MSHTFTRRVLVFAILTIGLSSGCNSSPSGPGPDNGSGHSEPIWSRALPVHSLAEPIAADLERVYTSSAFGVAALDQGTGETLWEEEPGTGIAGPSFLVVSGIVIVAHPDALVGLEAETGQRLWVTEATSVSWTSSNSGGLFTTDGESVVSRDPNSGATIWEAPLDAGGQVVLEAAMGLVCAERLVSPPADARITCYNQSDGTVEWTRLVHSPPWISVAPTLVVVAGLELGEGSGLMGLDRNNGSVIWKEPSLSGNDPAVSSGNDVLYTCSGGCTAIQGNTGEILWQTSIEKPLGSPALGNGIISVVAFLSDPNPLYILNATTGMLQNSILPDPTTDPGGFCGTPAISADLLFVFSCRGTLYAYRISSF